MLSLIIFTVAWPLATLGFYSLLLATKATP